MSHITYPHVYADGKGGYIAEMVDRKRGTVWGSGCGRNPMEAIYAARHSQPKDGVIRKALNLAMRHPVLLGGSIGAIVHYRTTTWQHREHDFWGYASAIGKGFIVAGCIIVGAYVVKGIVTGLMGRPWRQR